jgi:hypothetical protein
VEASARVSPARRQAAVQCDLQNRSKRDTADDYAADGIICRTVHPEVPPKVEYELTDFGRTLEPVLLSMKEWGEAYQRHLDRKDSTRLSCAPNYGTA